MPHRLAVLLLALLCGACASVPAGPEATPPPGPPLAAAKPPAEANPFERCSHPDDTDAGVLDDASHLLHETVCGSALWFDGLFGQGDLAAARRAHGLLEASVGHTEYDGTKARVRFNARVELPAMKRQLSAFVGRDDDEGFVRDRSEGLGLRSQFPSVADEDEWLAGLGYGLPEARRFKFDFRVGARGVRDPTVFARARFGYTAYSDYENLAYLRVTPFIDNKVGLGLTGSVDLDHALTASTLLRWGTAATVSEKVPGLDWRTATIAYQNLGQLRAVAGELFVRGLTAAGESIPEYGTRAIYRHPLFGARLFAELVVGYSWLQFDPAVPREGSFGTSFGLELPFGRD